MTNRIRVISGPEGSAQGTKVLMPDGSEMPGVFGLELTASVCGSWRAKIYCHCEVDIEVVGEQNLDVRLEPDGFKPVVKDDVTVAKVRCRCNSNVFKPLNRSDFPGWYRCVACDSAYSPQYVNEGLIDVTNMSDEARTFKEAPKS